MKALLCLLLSALSCVAQLTLNSALYPPILGGGGGNGPPVSGFTLWLHADDTSSLFTNDHTTNISGAVQATAGERVGIWLDRSIVAGTNHLYQFDATSGGNDRRPTLSSGWSNSMPVVTFPGSALNNQARLQSLTNNITFGVNTSAVTVCWIGALNNSGDSFNCVVCLDRTKMFLRRDNTNQKLEWGVNNGWAATANNFTYGKGYCWIGTFITNNAVQNNGSWALYRNGGTPDTVTAAPFTWQAADFLALGGNGATTPALDQWADCVIAEVIVWPFELSSVQVSNVNFWATNKYLLTP